MLSTQTFPHCSQRVLLEPAFVTGLVSTGPIRPVWMFFTKLVTSWREDAGDVFFWGPFHEGHTYAGVALATPESPRSSCCHRAQLRCCSTRHINRNLGRALYNNSWSHEMDYVWTGIMNTNVCLSKQKSKSVLRKCGRVQLQQQDWTVPTGTVVVPVW